MSKRKLMMLAILMTAVLIGVFTYSGFVQERKSNIPLVPSNKQKDVPRLETLASNLEVPWALAFLPASGNPFGNLTFSYGHRNPQGIAWDENNNLWETEHGPSGVWPNCCQDELNLIQKGENYGWPIISGNQVQNDMESTIIHSGKDTWAPSGTVYLNGSVFFAGLKGEAIYEAIINGEKITIKEHLKKELGRVREITVGPDNLLYIATSNRDGRGIPDNDDDKIIRVDPAKL